MTNGAIISVLRNSIKEVTSDSVFTNRFLYKTLRLQALYYIERERLSLSNSNLFTTEDLETEEYDLSSTCVPFQCMGCRVKLPVLNSKIGPLYKFVASSDFGTEWKIVSPLSFQRKKNLKSKFNYAYQDGDYLYFTDCPPCVRVCYLKDSLKDDSSEESCSRLEDEFIIPDYLARYVVQDSMQQLGLSLQKLQDHISNKNTTS